MDKKTPADTFVKEITSIPGGEGIRLCIQCGTCTASCPNADRMEYTPSELIALARAGMREEVLTSNSMWHCLSCYLCTVRCPRGIKPANLIHAVETIAEREAGKRGRYAGAGGYCSSSGNMDMAITIRTACVENGKLTVQAGAGIVADSDPESELAEAQAKFVPVRDALTGR